MGTSAQIKKVHLKNAAIICRQYEVFPPGVFCELGCYLLLDGDTLSFSGNRGLNADYLADIPDSLRGGYDPAQYYTEPFDPSPITNFRNVKWRRFSLARNKGREVSGQFIEGANRQELWSVLCFSGEVFIYGPEWHKPSPPIEEGHEIYRPCEPTYYPKLAVLVQAKKWRKFSKLALKKMGLGGYGRQRVIKMFYCE